MKGKLKKSEEGWHIMCIEEGDWETYYPLHKGDSLYIIDVDEGNEVEFKIVTVGGKDDLIGKEYARIVPIDEYGYPILEGINNLLEERKTMLQSQRELAESLWEGCDGCDENDKYFWIKGFIAALNYKS